MAADAASTVSDCRCNRLRMVGEAQGRGGAWVGGLSNDGLMKGEVGGDWDERLDKAGEGNKRQAKLSQPKT